MIKLGRPQLQTSGDRTRLSATVTIAGETRTIWLELQESAADGLCTELSDGFVAAILLLAMKRGEDIVSEAPVSERLFYQITKYLMPFLAHINQELRVVRLLADVRGPVACAGRVGTGISCGLDSLTAVYQETAGAPCPDYRVDTLVYLNVGHYGTDANAHAVWEQYALLPGRFADAHGMPLLKVDSNFFEFMPYALSQVGIFALCGAVLQMQPLFKVYYVASSFTLFDFAADFQETGLYEPFAIDCLSTESLKFYSSGALENRVEKLKTIIDEPSYMKYLYCCVASNGGEHNCSNCEKCVRTYLNAYALGKTDKLRQTFDVDAMDRRRDQLLAYMLKKRKARAFEGRFYQEIYAEMQKNGRPIPLKARYMALLPYHYSRYRMVWSLRESLWYHIKTAIKRIIGR